MATPVIYPKVSLETGSGRIARWRVAEGDRVRMGQVLFEIDNDKAAVEVAATANGIISGLASESEEIAVGEAVAAILAEGETADVRKAAAAPAAALAAGPPAARFESGLPASARPGLPRPTPLARRIARDHGVSLAGLPGSGPRGRVQRKDVMALIAGGRDQPAARASLLALEWLRRGAAGGLGLIHGFSADLNSWRGLMAAARFDAAVAAIDLPCHGRSPRQVPADLDDIAAQVEATFAAAGAAPTVLGGHSFGALVAARIAARGLLPVKALALFAPAGLGPAVNGSFVEGILRATAPESLRPWLLELVHDPALVSDALVAAVAEARRDAGLITAMRRFADVFMPDGTQRYSIRADLEKIDLPVRVIFGRNDRILPFGDTAGLPGQVALHAISGCGHLPHLEHAALASRILAEMLRGAA